MDTILYHGSGFDQKELMPGFMRTGKLVEWDETESNHFLYTTTDKDEAISQAFASMIEKTYESTEYHRHGNEIQIVFPKVVPSLAELKKLRLFLYAIRLEAEDGWVKNANEHNQITTEWKTPQVVTRHILHKEQVNLEKWLEHRKLTLATEGVKEDKPNWLLW